MYWPEPPDQCQKLTAMIVYEWPKAAKENYFCFSCRKQVMNTLSSWRKQCKKFENEKQCTFSHHPLLHKSNIISATLASVASQSPKRLASTGDRCLYLGSKRSVQACKCYSRFWSANKSNAVIGNETADCICLKVKVGGEELIHTKSYGLWRYS